MSAGLQVANHVAMLQQEAVDRVLARGIDPSQVHTYSVPDATECGVTIGDQPVCAIFTTLVVESENPSAEIFVWWAPAWIPPAWLPS